MWQLRRGQILGRSALDASAAASSFSLTATANSVDLNTLTTYSFASQNLGTEDSTRIIAVCIMTRNSAGTQAVSSASFNGVAATSAVGVSNSTSNRSEIWYAAVPTGTSGTISITFAGANQRCAIQVYSIIAPSSAAPTATGTSTTNTAPTATLTIPSGGAAIGCNYTLTGGPGTPVGTPSGFDNVDLNNNLIATQQAFAIHSNAGALSGSQNLTMTFTGSTSNSAVFATWGP